METILTNETSPSVPNTSELIHAEVNASDLTQTISEMNKKKIIAPMLGLKEDDPFDIVSETDTGLVMVHYRPDADVEIFGNLRGVVVDINVGKVVSYSFPYTPRVITSSMIGENGNLTLGGSSTGLSNLRFKIGFEGTLIHVFKHGGKVYRTTRKRLDATRSRWGNSKTFGEMYWELNGPKDEVLFDPTKDYSPYCHYFILVHPQVLVSTKDDISSGYLVYLGPKQIYSTSPTACPYPMNSVDCDLHVPETSSSNTRNSSGAIYSPENLTLEEANKHLSFGFYETFDGYQYLDPRLLPGEFVIVENVETKQMFRVESTSYAWRSDMRNNNPNLLHRFFELLDFAYLKKEDDNKFRTMFPILTLYDPVSLFNTISSAPIIVWPQNTENDFSTLPVPNTKEGKLYNIWQSFLLCVPISRQKEVFGFYDVLVTRRSELITWLIETSKKMVSSSSSTNTFDMSLYSNRARDILLKTRSFAENRYRSGDNIDNRTKEAKTVESLTRDNIRNFISKEKGSSLYRLIREMDRIKNPRDVHVVPDTL
jgi:hypothetical protein